ncbi:hypothetical protein CLF_105777 [Clonorchis sinensis]|uniref:Uncharacterized protein n=1 Tax=Clonorchis sinensis TaxID=79923 RepID=G7YPE9_CLOSI|nr:hypothetical protein CLF_105777 [Clonorchis sinensis]
MSTDSRAKHLVKTNSKLLLNTHTGVDKINSHPSPNRKCIRTSAVFRYCNRYEPSHRQCANMSKHSSSLKENGPRLHLLDSPFFMGHAGLCRLTLAIYLVFQCLVCPTYAARKGGGKQWTRAHDRGFNSAHLTCEVSEVHQHKLDISESKRDVHSVQLFTLQYGDWIARSSNPSTPKDRQYRLLEIVENFTYLGSCISSDGSVSNEVSARISKTRITFASLHVSGVRAVSFFPDCLIERLETFGLTRTIVPKRVDGTIQ